MQFKYKYEHMDCRLCAEASDGDCRYLFCPHITENLDDLRRDPDFTDAVKDAFACRTPHRTALILLKTRGFKGRARRPEDPPMPEPANYGIKPECEGCPYPNHGFVCHSEKDGSCMKTDWMAAMERSKTSCRAV